MVLKEEVINQNYGVFAGRIAQLRKREKDALIVLAVNRGSFVNFLVFFSNDRNIVDGFRVSEYVRIHGYVKTGYIAAPRREGEEGFHFQKLIATDIRRPESRLKKLGLHSRSDAVFEPDENRLILSGKVTYLGRKEDGYDLLRIRIEEEPDEETGKIRFQAPGIVFYKEKKKWLDEIEEGDSVCVQAEIQTFMTPSKRKITRIVCNDLAKIEEI